MGKLKGKTALITGSTRGIGLAIAREFLAEDARVVISSRKTEAVKIICTELEKDYPNQVMGLACHIGKVETHQSVFEDINSKWGPVDVLVNNAAANPYFGPMMSIDWGAFDKTIAVNIRGTFSVSRAFASQLPKECSGSIINVASIFGRTAAPLQGTYGLTKAAILSLTQTLSHEWAPFGIRVNAIAPGLVETDFAKALTENPQIVKSYTTRAAQSRYGDPKEIGGVVVFLASDDASYVTGQQWNIDGGYLCG